jgi:hypothetical protein
MKTVCKFVWEAHFGVDLSTFYFGVVKDWSVGICGAPVAIDVCSHEDVWATGLIQGRWYEIEFFVNGTPVSAREVPDPFAEKPVTTATEQR